jgi:hypothetical protein
VPVLLYARRRFVVRRELERQQLPDLFLARDRRIAQSFNERPRDRRAHGRDEVEPERGEVRRQHRDLDDERLAAERGGDPLDICR